MKIYVNISAERSFVGEDLEENEVRFTLNESLIRPGTTISRKNEVREQLMKALDKAITFIGLEPDA